MADIVGQTIKDTGRNVDMRVLMAYNTYKTLSAPKHSLKAIQQPA